MPKLPEPFDSSPEQFSAMVGIVAELTAERKARLKTSPGSNISFKIEPSLLRERSQQKGIDQSSALKILNEISAMTNLVLRERIDSFVEHAIESAEEEQSKLSPQEKEQIKGILADKAEILLIKGVKT